MVQNSRVLDATVARLMSSRSPVTEGLFNMLADGFPTKLEGFVEKLTRSLVSGHCEQQSQQISTLEEENKELRARLDEAETNRKLDSLIFHAWASAGGGASAPLWILRIFAEKF